MSTVTDHSIFYRSFSLSILGSIKYYKIIRLKGNKSIFSDKLCFKL